MRLTITTINTWKGEGNYASRIVVLARQLSALDTGLILCQECFRTIDGTADTLAFLSGALGMTAFRAECRVKERLYNGHMRESSSGLGVLSRVPVLEETILTLPSDPVDGGRVAQCLLLEPRPGFTLFVANVHLSHVRGAAALRAVQLQTVLDAADDSGATCRLIGGDFNASADSEEMRSIAARAADTYNLCGASRPRTTLLHGNSCIDYLFLYPLAYTTDYPACADARIVLHQCDEETGLYPSDHFGCSTTLILD